ncbi:PAS domain S-box protein [Draconibacterium halophilum]|uniref:Sensory/regulatory protein RpfC n=1 Tax=Draconibacterium halophilum TaxID=2706887 RepID=A0A6C0RFY1_9BACT|nr:PAS domain S-box protein [Draconibacterium halophilum]QIA07981.1 PAS domain S-box protein [Draconibacterium halophilum]
MRKIIFIIIYFIIAINNLYSQKVVKVGAFNFYPAIFQDTDGEIKGFYVDAFHEIEAKENIEFQYVFGTWDECLQRIQDEEIDMMVSVAHTEERATYLDYSSEPLITVWGEVYTSESSEIHGVLDLEGKTIAVMKSDMNGEQLKVLTKKMSINCIFLEKPDFQEIFESIVSKEVDAGVVNSTFGAGKSEEYDIRSSGIVFNPFDIYVTVKKNENTELLNLVTKYLKTWKYDLNSVYNTSRQKWSHEKVGVIQFIPKWLKSSLYSIFGIAMLLVVFIFLLRHRVKKATTKVEENEQKLKQSDRVFNLSLDMFCIAGFDGYFKYLNPAWEKTLGWSIEELLSKPWNDFVHPDDIEKTENVKSVIVDGIEIYKFENRYICKDGSIKWFSWNSQPFPKENIMIGAVRDITETKKIENELIIAKEKAEESEEILKTTLQTAMDGYWVVDINGRFLNVNDTYCNMSGYIREDLLSMQISDVEAIQSPEEINKNIQRIKQLGQLRFETKHVRKDGTIYDVDLGVQYQESNDDRFVCFIKEITDKKNAENELKKSESIQRKMVANIGDVIVIIDKNGINRYKSPNVKRQFGWEVDELVGKSAWEKVHPDHIERAKKLLSDLEHEPEKTITTELRYLRKDGKYRWIEITISNLQYDPDIDGFLGNYHDITERKLDEEALQNSQEMLLSSQSLANICSYSTNLSITDIDKSQWVCSPEFYKIFGIDETYPHTIKGWIGFLHPDYRDDVVAYHESVVLEKKSFSREYKIIRINDSVERWVHGTGELVYDENGNPIRMHGAIQDITESKQAELALKIKNKELIKAKEKAEEADRLKSAFLANMSHEIRTPMNGILGFTTLLQEADLSVENQRNYIDIIEKSGNRLLNTVNDIIEISKIESGEINVVKSEVDIIGYLDTLVTFFKPEAQKKNLEFIVQNNIDGNGLFIQTDKTKLSSILSNLIKNAIKYTNEGTIKVGLNVNNNQILFSCQDTGIGIPKNRQEAIFNRFEQADIEDKQAHQGSGLGLAIVKSYVEMLGGKIWVESEEGRGSIFYVSLPYNPVKKQEQDDLKKDTGANSNKKKINVLVVEDDEVSLLHLSIILAEITPNVLFVQNGIEAIEKCKNDSNIDLVLMDLKMPQMGGIEATQRIREFNNNIVIIAQTAYAFREDKEKAKQAGCNDFITKPIDKDNLIKIINKYYS